MPYISKGQRPALDKLIDPLTKYLKSLPLEDQDGSLNYTITRVIKHLYPPKYFHFNRVLGVLSAVTQELYRKIIGPYEEQKISENGDVE